MKILLAEDDLNMQKILKIYLEKEGYQLTIASDGEEALDYIVSENFDLAILDWMMPKKDGMELCEDIRRMAIPIKILMLTAKNTSIDELKSLTAGADEYISKPFEMPVLLIRIKKLVRGENVLKNGALSLNIETFEVRENLQGIDLTRKEYDLLHYFMSNIDITLSREQILDNVWGIDYEGDTRTVDTHVKRLRKKLSEDYIETKVRLGYVMRSKDE
ncbi:response regulator transcription factor [Vagococcus carniphilus]|uniref:response regulator transcription factor n=1 Tax=Vagococcus carniphilus TaxID=218144 RepID=UPI00288E4D64|nr:response regulator transcription factor [Vagococcus carniphilus]MDT2814575.1 response regulator transcription factor [Vagococcus carniphilus]MDT2864196.1 response regulator transcription factor [Vagococcus carniphilus]